MQSTEKPFNEPLVLPVIRQVVTNPASAVVTVVTAAAVGYLELSSLVGVIVGGIVGFILSSQLLNIGQ